VAITLWQSARIVGAELIGGMGVAELDATVQWWGRRMFDVSRTTLQTDGDEHAPPEPCVVLSNHRSLLDIPAVVVAFPGRLTFVAKEELSAVPLFGRALRRFGVVFVDRGRRTKAVRQLGEAAERVAEGTSIWIAAEGRRTHSRAPGRFKKGPFHVAGRLGAPLLPTWIEGTAEVIPPASVASHSGRVVRVFFGPPIPTTGVDLGDRAALAALMERAHAAMEALAERASEEAT